MYSLIWGCVFHTAMHLLHLTSDLVNGVCDQFALNGVVCPPKMRIVGFLQWQQLADNINYNPSAATAKILLGISLMQHSSQEFEGSYFYIQ